MNFLEQNEKYNQDLKESLKSFTDINLLKKRLTYARLKATENLDKLLFEFDTNLKKTDSKVTWCHDEKSVVDFLNTQLKSVEKVSFLNHIGVNNLISILNIESAEETESPEIVVMDAKFIVANTGNFYTPFYSQNEWQQASNAKKIIVCAGIDTILASQAELNLAKTLYSIYETGLLSYSAEMLARPGKMHGFKPEIVLMIYDLSKSHLLERINHRGLFHLLNFKLPPVCPMHALDYYPENRMKLDTLQYFLFPFVHGLENYPSHILENYGLHIINQFLPYEIDLKQHVLEAREFLNAEKKANKLASIFGGNIAELPLHKEKFNKAGRFEKFAKEYFFGQ